ncbi:MAG: HD domain-containing protein [Magnetospirillum gryphiswaldense]|nr:HD domain-containing protein [Magnetospirillum gryphiswaldense]
MNANAVQMGWGASIRVWVFGSLLALCAGIAGAIAFIQYELNLRKHDYQILNLAGQMRVLAVEMQRQSNELLAGGGVNLGGALDRELSLFDRDIADKVELYDLIITGFHARELPAELIGSDEPLRCNWDHTSTSQLDVSVAAWRGFRDGMARAAGGDPSRPNSLKVAAYLAANGHQLVESTENLAKAFQSMMEGKLLLIRVSVMAMAAGVVIASLGLAFLLQRGVLRPLDMTVAAFRRVAAGDLGFQVPIAHTREIGGMTRAFNNLSSRLQGLFRLTERISQGADADQTLAFIHEEFSHFLSVDFLALLVAAPDRSRFVVERVHGKVLSEKLGQLSDPVLSAVCHSGQPRLLSMGTDECGLAALLGQLGLRTALLLPLSSVREGGAVLLVGSGHDKAYGLDEKRFLHSIAAHVDSVLSRTLVMDSLIVAAVEGLAKLAESRDPETGNHLVRMSLYSALLAEEMTGDPHYARDIHRFAPMHDIGKVGIADSVLLKPGRLDDVERREMCRHPLIGGEVLRLSEERMAEEGRSVFRLGIEIAEAHHEKWDGSGYPRGLTGTDIPLSARIVAVADVFDALTSKRPYKDAWSVDRALETLRQDAGTHFDPDVVAAFERILPKVLDIHSRLAHH